MEDQKDKKVNGYSPELSRKIIGLMKLSLGKSLSEFPMPSVTKWMGGTLLEVDRGVIAVEIKVRPEMLNPGGQLHGGMQGAMIDDVMGTACATLGYETSFFTINLSVDYLGTAAAGDTVVARGYIYREGRTMIHAVGEIKKDDVLIAKGQSNILISNQPAGYVDFIKNLKI